MNKNSMKELFRRGIPDVHKREMIQKLFNLKGSICNFEYNAVKESQTKDFLLYCRESKIVSDHLYYDFLTEEGKVELDFILMYMEQNMEVERIQFLGVLASLLLIYMPASEVFCVL